MPSPRLPGLNGLKLQFHCVPCSFEIVSVPLGPEAEPPDDPDGEEELQAATAARRSAAVPVKRRRLMRVVLRSGVMQAARQSGKTRLGGEHSPEVPWSLLSDLAGCVRPMC
jgi:hypothetical protein